MALSELFAMFCGLFFIFNACFSQVKGDISETPANFTKVVGNKISKNADVFYLWGYGGALIFDGLWQANQSSGIPYGAQVNDYLDMFIRDKSQYGYRSGTVNSKSFVGKVLLRIKQKFKLNYAL